MPNHKSANTIQVTNRYGVTFNVRIVESGDAYGKDMCLTHSGENLIEFYHNTGNSSVAPDGTVLGFFISRYFQSTIAKCTAGINLCGYVRNYEASDANILAVQQAFC